MSEDAINDAEAAAVLREFYERTGLTEAWLRQQANSLTWRPPSDARLDRVRSMAKLTGRRASKHGDKWVLVAANREPRQSEVEAPSTLAQDEGRPFNDIEDELFRLMEAAGEIPGWLRSYHSTWRALKALYALYGAEAYPRVDLDRGHQEVRDVVKSGPTVGFRGVVEGAKGMAKEAVGSVLGKKDLEQEGEAQHEKAESRRGAAKKEDTGKSRRGAAKKEATDLHKDDSVTITGFGVFEQRRRAARVARNPRTGETVKVKPTSVPAFRPGAGTEPTSPRPRHLHARLPDRVETGQQLSLIVMITLAPTEGSSGLKGFVVPSEGATVTVIVSSPGLVPNGNMQQDISVPAEADSEPHRFAFTAGPVGLHPVTVEAYRGGTYLGAVRLQVSVEQSAAAVSEGKPKIAELARMFAEPGEVTLQVRRVQGGCYRFQLLGDSLYPDVESMMGDSDTAVAQLVAELRSMAANQAGYATPELVRARLKNLGIALWTAAVPEKVQEQFWAQAGRIKMFTIASDHDMIPWELLYPANGSNDNGFLAEQFPVVRRAYATPRVDVLPIRSAAYVIPPNAPTDALDEVNAIRTLLGSRIGDRGVLSELSVVSKLMLNKRLPSIIHFACHNTFSDDSGSSIALKGGPWKPSDLAEAVAKTSLAAGRPLVFLNACRSAGEIAWFSRMSGWSEKFVGAGAGACIGSLWAVRSSAARRFAEVFYEQFVAERQPLGVASLRARQAVSEDGGDPTWLAYSVYGNPAAVITRGAGQ